MNTNEVITPAGPGIVECTWQLHHRARVLVRVRITAENQEHLRDENCATPGNQIFGLWIYDAADVNPMEVTHAR